MDLNEQVMALCRELGTPHGEAIARYDLGRLSLATGDAPAAVRLHEQSLALIRVVETGKERPRC
ncbi:tetratricopeptide repeat protein [Catenulispora sp. EB89]|uniref:tetratricopeptide repeat protein n=1 Tax=Catenulispora sp. EB89 TaxID=3156257 RepID=UPI003517C182